MWAFDKPHPTRRFSFTSSHSRYQRPDRVQLAAYAQAISVLRSCELFLRQDPSTKGEVENFAFHLSMLTVIAMTRKNTPRAEDLASLDQVPSGDLLRTLLPEWFAKPSGKS